MKNNFKYGTIKCCIVGSCNVGKTSIIQKYLTNKNNTETTLGAIYWLIEHTSDCGKHFKIDFWDTAGQERYNSLIPMYSRNSDIILLTFDITIRETFTDLQRWIKVINSFETNNTAHIIIIGNKTDLELFRQVEKKEVDDFIRHNFSNQVTYWETSAKTGENINSLFNKIFNIAVDKIKVTNSFNKKNMLELKIINSKEDEIERKYQCCNII